MTYLFASHMDVVDRRGEGLEKNQHQKGRFCQNFQKVNSSGSKKVAYFINQLVIHVPSLCMALYLKQTGANIQKVSQVTGYFS